MAPFRPTLLIALAALGCASRLSAEELLPPSKPVPAVIDHYVDALLKTDSIDPAPQADDYTLIRRLTLDLVGRVPTVTEVEAFVKSKEADKRAKLVDRLIASPGFVRFQAAQFDVMLNGTVAGDTGGKKGGTLRDYLQSALADGKTWDKIFRELLTPAGNDPKQAAAASYLLTRIKDTDRLTNDVSVAFFGVNVSCAQCHDHPSVADWTQEHFYGMKSFLARSYDVNGMLAERPAGLVKYKPTKGPEKTAGMMFLTGTKVTTDTAREPTKEEQKAEKEALDKVKKDKSVKVTMPAPAFSARAKLVDVALQKGDADLFARSIVNRLFHRFLGYGLVMPLDQMHSENPPSHPELMDWLARDTQAHGYDLRRLIRGIVLSKTYSRASTYPSAAHPQPMYFAVARLKPLTPGQMATSMKLTTRDPASFEKLKPEEFEKQMESLEASARGFASMLTQPTDDFQVGVNEALLFSNGDKVMSEFLSDGQGMLLAQFKNEKDTHKAVKVMTQSILGRPATPAEVSALSVYISKRNDRPGEAHRQVLWALMTCPEFRFNH